MKNGWIRLHALSFLLMCGAAQALPTKLHFVIKIPPQTPTNRAIWITGNLPELCNWNPQCIKPQVTGPGLLEAWVDVNAAPGTQFEFKVTRGDYDFEAAYLTGYSYLNFKDTVGTQPLVRRIDHWKDLPPQFVTGHLEIIPNFPLPALQSARTLRVWLPPSYPTSGARRYPVIYFHDGQNLFDPRTSTSEADWMVDEAMTRLASRGLEAIIVGIDSLKGDARMAEYDFTQRGFLYAQDLVNQIKPFIDAHYKTNPSRPYTFSAGSSMGAHFTLSLLERYPTVFSAGIGLSLPADIHDGSIFKVLQPLPGNRIKDTHFFFDHGDWGWDSDYGPGAKQLFQALLQDGYTTSNLRYEVVPWADHTEGDWARRVESRLELLLRLLNR